MIKDYFNGGGAKKLRLNSCFFIRAINMLLESGAGMEDTLKRFDCFPEKLKPRPPRKKVQETLVKMLISLVLYNGSYYIHSCLLFYNITINFIKTGS
jgi:hypothetical protein